MAQVARSLAAADDGFLRGVEYLILDRDPLYDCRSGTCCGTVVTPLLLPARSRNLNAFAKRFVEPVNPSG